MKQKKFHYKIIKKNKNKFLQILKNSYLIKI